MPGTATKLRELVPLASAAVEGPRDGEEGITLLAAKALMREGGVIACDAPRAPFPALAPEARAGLLAIARTLDPLVLRWRG